MNKNYNLKLDLQFRCNNTIMKFNQFDNNTSDFFMRITNGGKLVDIEKAIVVLAIIKPSGKVASQFVEIENGLVYADLKPNMRDEIGTYTAQAMLILEDERVVTDVISYEVEEDKIFSLLNDTVETSEEFTLLTDMLSRLSNIEISEEQRVINEAERILSEENRKIEETKRVEAELIRVHEEADRTKYDATRESNENIRKQNESIRLANETNRIDEEAKRVDEENKRKLAEEERKANYNFMTEDEERRRSEANAHKEAEVLRVQAETNRVNEEAKRRTTEQGRVSAENTRVSNENTREANEITRKSNETKRVEAETQRQNRYNSFITDAEANANNFENYTNNAKVKEEERKSNELDRKSQEDRRVSNEVERISNENTRKANEEIRESNEISRQNVFENKVDEFDEKIVELNTTKDNFISSVNTKVDNKISELDNAKSDMTTTVSNKVNEVETRFNALTSSQQQDAEVIDARDGETSLKARLDRDIEKAKQVYVNVEGSHISTDSNVGYLKNVEILGNTIQDASNLADIRSVGDKVEGQELYEIPIQITNGLEDTEADYQEDKLTILSPVQLEKVGDVADRIIEKDGVWGVEKNIVNYNLTKDLNWAYGRGTTVDGIQYFGYKAVIPNPIRPALSTKIANLICNHCKPTSNFAQFTASDGINTISQYTDSDEVQIMNTSEVFNSVDSFKNWISDKNISIKYPTTQPQFIPLPHDQQIKLRTFASKTNISFGCEIEGTIKAQVPKSLGATVNTHTEQINNLNKELDRVKKLEESTVSTVTTESDFTTVEATSNGYFEDVKLEGKTLVNLFDKNKPWTQGKHNGIEGASIYKQYEVNKSSNNTYHIIAPIGDKSSNFTDARLMIYAYNKVTNRVSKLIADKSSNSHESINTVLTLTNDEVLLFNCWDISEDKFNKNYPTMMILEGDHTQNPPSYFEGLKSVGQSATTSEDGVEEVSVESVNENLFDGDNSMISGAWTASGAHFETKEEVKCKNPYTPIPKGIDKTKGMYISITDTEYNEDGNIHIYDKNKKIITTLYSENSNIRFENGIIFIPPTYLKNAEYFSFRIVSTNIDHKWGIFNAPMNYVENKSDKKRLLYYNEETQAWEKPILRQWDSIEKHADGKYYYHQRSGEVVLNGSESWDKSDSGYQSETTGNVTFHSPFVSISSWGNSSYLICDIIPSRVGSEGVWGAVAEGITTDSSKIMISILESKLSTQDVQGFKQWLQANNVTVVYQLAQEKVYECTNIDLITYANETNYIVNSGAIVPKTTLKVHNNISNVVSLLQKKVSLLESNVKASQEVQDMMILETDMRMLDIELALMEFIPMKLNLLGGSDMLRSATYFNFLKNHIVNETYEKEYLENVMNKYLATGRINQDEYDELYKMLYPPVYDIELPIEY